MLTLFDLSRRPKDYCCAGGRFLGLQLCSYQFDRLIDRKTNGAGCIVLGSFRYQLILSGLHLGRSHQPFLGAKLGDRITH